MGLSARGCGNECSCEKVEKEAEGRRVYDHYEAMQMDVPDMRYPGRLLI
jgi:hypothetical protein